MMARICAPSRALLALALLVGAAAVTEAQTTHTGFLIDVYCWDRSGHVALDGANLETEPERHTVHCMADIQSCRDGGFALLGPKDGGGYEIKYRLDEEGNANALVYLDALNAAEGGMRNNVMVTASGELSEDSLTLRRATVETAQGAGMIAMSRMSELTSGLILETTYDATTNMLTATMVSSRNAWVGFGVTFEGGGMTAGGVGSDMIICTQAGGVKRYWATEYVAPTNGIDVPGATCVFSEGTATMIFSRAVEATGNRQRAITPGTAQDIIWAYGGDGDLNLARQHEASGISRLDLADSGGMVISLERPVAWSLWLHLLFMTFAWGWFLPFGAAIAKWTRKGVSGAKEGAWFKMHRILQSIGLFCVILGFIFVIIHAELEHTHIFDHHHAIMGIICVSIAVLQPVNALIRPHASEDGDSKSIPRIAWEVVHKGLGWGAIWLSIPTMITGALLILDLQWERAAMGVGLGIGMAGSLCFLVYMLIAGVMRDNPISQAMVGGGGGGSMA